MKEQNQEIINRALEIINSQIVNFDLEISVDYKTQRSFQLMLKNYMGDNLYSKLYSFKKTNYKDLNISITDFLSEIFDIVIERENFCTMDMVIAFEYDPWMSYDSQSFKGVFTSKINALLKLQIHYKTILFEESNGQFIDYMAEFDEETIFDKVSISNVAIDEVE